MKVTKRNQKAEFVKGFFDKQTKFKKIQSQFNGLKSQFNSDMEDYFKSEGIEKSTVFSCDEFIGNDLVVNRVQKTSIEFNPNKLEKALGKELSEQVIVKQYEIVDMDALITYLKECDVNPKIFKTFLNISKSVNVQELERLEELGKVTAKQIKGCYTIKCQKPYFTVSMKRGHDNEEC